MDRPCSVKRKKYTAAAKKPTSAASFSHVSVLPVSMIILRLRSCPPDQTGSTSPRQPFLEQPLDRWSEPGAVVGVAQFLDGLRLCRIRVDGIGDRPQTQAADHRQRQLGDHLAGVGGDDGGSENLVSPGTDKHLDKAIILTVEDGSVHIVQLLREGAEGDAALPGLVFVQADMGDLRVGVGTPRDDERAGACASFEQGVLDDDA